MVRVVHCCRVQWEVGSGAIGSGAQRLPIRAHLNGLLYLTGPLATAVLEKTPLVLHPAWAQGDLDCSLKAHGAKIQSLFFSGDNRVIHCRCRVHANKELMMNSCHALR